MNKKIVMLFILILIASSLIILKPAYSSTKVTQNTWTERAPMPTARGGLGVATVNGKIYAIGGIGGVISTAIGTVPYSSGFLNTNEAYDPETNTWETKAPMPTARDNFAIAVCQNKIYCIGGVTGMGTVNYEGTGLLLPAYLWSTVNEVYNPATNTWENKTAMPSAPYAQLTANEIDGKIYMLGGLSTQPIMVYDPANDSWSTEQTQSLEDSWQQMQIQAFNFSANEEIGNQFGSAVYENKIFALSYYIGFNPDRALFIYDSINNSWNAGSSAPSGVSYSVAVATSGLFAPTRIYFIGTTGTYTSQTANYVYDPLNSSWQIGSAMPTSRAYFGMATVNDKMYVIGGYTKQKDFYQTSSAINEEFTPFGYGDIPPSINVLSPVNVNYSSGEFILNFTTNKPVDWLGYSLDGKEKVTLTGNITLTGLSKGLHNITVYANDTFGNIGSSETIKFNITSEPFPTVPVAVGSTALIVGICVGLIVYFKKRKH